MTETRESVEIKRGRPVELSMSKSLDSACACDGEIEQGINFVAQKVGASLTSRVGC